MKNESPAMVSREFVFLIVYRGLPITPRPINPIFIFLYSSFFIIFFDDKPLYLSDLTEPSKDVYYQISS